MDSKGGKLRWGGDDSMLNWVIGIDMYKVLCIKLMTNKNLQYKTTTTTKKKTFIWYYDIFWEIFSIFNNQIASGFIFIVIYMLK